MKKKGKVLLVNPNRIKPPVIPLALEYLASSIESRGWEVDILDLCFVENFRKAVDDYFKKNHPLAIGMTLRNTDDCMSQTKSFFIPEIKRIVSYLKSKTSLPILLGGCGFSLMPGEIVEYTGVTTGIKGEGEEALPYLLEKIKRKEKLPPVFTFPREVNLRISPSPKRGWVDNLRYFKEGGMGAVETKRGCPENCIYCADPLIKGKKSRVRPPSVVVEEIKSLYRMGVNWLHLCDSEFNLPYSAAREFCEELIKNKMGEKVKWYTYASPLPFDEKLALLMKKAGCEGINFGVDSGENTILANLRRRHRREDILRIARICHKYKITFMFDLLLGGPGETKATLRKTIEFVKKLNPSCVGVAVGIRIYPGTFLAKKIKKERKITDNFLRPIFYFSPLLGKDFMSYLENLIGDDERFFTGWKREGGKDYNYNENLLLVEAIKRGSRGAFWDILRKIKTSSIPT